MLNILLTFHIATALLMSFIAIWSLVVIIRRRTQGLSENAKALSILFFAEIVSGSGLGLVSPVFSPTNFCVNIFFYLAGYVLIEFAIFFALRSNLLTIFPYRYAWTSVIAGLAFPIFVLLVRVPLFY